MLKYPWYSGSRRQKRGDPKTEIMQIEDGRFVVTHSFFMVGTHGPFWEDIRDKMVAVGCEVEPIKTFNEHHPRPHGRLSFRVTLPEGTVRGTVRRWDDYVSDIFVHEGVFFSVLRPEGFRSCRTLQMAKLSLFGDCYIIGNASEEIAPLVAAAAA